MPRAAIFLNQCLPLSEIFVQHQATALQHYQPLLTACRFVSPSAAGDLPAVIINHHYSLKEKIAEQCFKLFGYSRKLLYAIKQTDIVHAHFGPAGWLASQLTHIAKRPLVVTLHGFDVLKNDVSLKKDGILQYLYAMNRKKLGNRTARFICVSEYVKKRAIAFGLPAEKCQVHYMGIPLLPHQAAKRERQAGEPFRLLAVGRLVPFKAHAKLIDAVAKAQNAGFDVELHIIGDGPLRNALEAQAKSSLRSYHFHGAKPHHQVLKLMRESDIFCHTSMHQPNGQTEAFGLVLLEAQWAGLPVVAFASGGVPEALLPEVTGLLCEEGDVSAFSQALCTLMENNERREQMTEAAPKFVAEKFDNRRQTEILETIYDEVIAMDNNGGQI